MHARTLASDTSTSSFGAFDFVSECLSRTVFGGFFVAEKLRKVGACPRRSANKCVRLLRERVRALNDQFVARWMKLTDQTGRNGTKFRKSSEGTWFG